MNGLLGTKLDKEEVQKRKEITEAKFTLTRKDRSELNFLRQAREFTQRNPEIGGALEERVQNASEKVRREYLAEEASGNIRKVIQREKEYLGHRDTIFPKDNPIGKLLNKVTEIAAIRPGFKEQLTAWTAQEQTYKFTDFEKSVLTEQTDGLIDSARMGQYTVHKQQNIALNYHAGNYELADAHVTKLQQMEEASAKMEAGESYLGKGVYGAAGSILPMVESMALAAATYGVGDKAFWLLQGQGEVIYEYAKRTDQKLTDLSLEEKERLETSSLITGSLYAATEYLGGVYGLQRKGSIIPKKTLIKLQIAMMKDKTFFGEVKRGGAKFLLEWFAENTEEGLQKFWIETGVDAVEGKFKFEESVKEGWEEFKNASSSTLVLVGMGGIVTTTGQKISTLAQSEKDMTNEVMESAQETVLHMQLAEEMTTSQMRDSLGRESIDTLLAQVRQLGITPTKGTAKGFIDTLIEYKDMNPQYEVRLQENFQKNLTADKELTTLQKNEYKWMAQGNVSPSDIIQNRLLMEAMVKESGYEGTLDQFFNKQIESFGKDGFIEFNQMGESEILSYLGQEISPLIMTPSIKARTKTDEFKNWFKGSTEHSAGTPLVYFHGSARDITAFESTSDIAGHFTLSPLTAAGFARESAWKKRTPPISPKLAEKEEMGIGKPVSSADRVWTQIYPVFINVQNPFDYRNPEHVRAVMERIAVLELSTDELPQKYFDRWDLVSEDLSKGDYQVLEIPAVRHAIKTLGHDAYYETEHKFQEIPNIAVFEPSSIKSIFNQGEWSEQSEFILKQLGPIYKTGTKAIRGQTRILPATKFVIDLFATGDVLTLAHEFAHVLSPYLDKNIMNSIIDKVMEKHTGLNKGLRTVRRNIYNRVWELFQQNPSLAASTMPLQMKEMLTEIQETLATNFENYLVTETAPVGELQGVFETLRNRYIEYYRDVRKLPVKFQKVDSVLAQAFDNMIAGDKSLVRPTFQEVILLDKEIGLEENKTKREAHRTLLQYIQRRQELERQQALKKLKGTYKKFKMRGTGTGKQTGVDITTKEAANRIMAQFDIKPRTEKELRKLMPLYKAWITLKEGLSDVPPELLSVDMKILKRVQDLDKPSLDNLAKEEITEIQNLLEDLLAYDKTARKQHAEYRIKKFQKLEMELDQELIKNWRYKKKKGKMLSTKIGNKVDKVLRPFGGITHRQLVNLKSYALESEETLHAIIKALESGDKRVDEINKTLTQTTRNIYQGLPDKGVSESLRQKVSSGKKYTVELRRKVSKDRYETTPINFTIAELMMVYGYAQDPKLRQDMVEKGIRIEEFSNEDLRFSSIENIFTTVDKLPLKFKRVVDQVMKLYDNTIYDIITPIYRELTGYTLKKEANYLPTYREWLGRGNAEFLNISSIEQDSKAFIRQHIGSMEFLNIRQPGQQALYIKDFFSAIDNNLSRVAFYAGMAEPIYQARILLTASENVVGTAANKLRVIMGPEYKQLKKFLDNIESPTHTSDDVEAAINRWNNRARKGILKSPVIGLFQIFSIKGCQNYGVKRSELLKAVGKQIFKGPKIISDLMNQDPRLWMRYAHLPQVEMGMSIQQTNTRLRWLQQKSILELGLGIRNWGDLIDFALASEEGMLFFIKYMDAYALTVQLEATREMGKRKGWNENQIIDHFMEIVHNTQPMQKPLYTSNFLAHKNPMVRILFGIFRSQRDAYLGERQRNLMEIQNRKNGQGKEFYTYARSVSNIWRVIITSALIFSFVKEAVYRMGRDDFDEAEKTGIKGWMLRTLTSILSFWPGGGDISAGLINLFTRKYGGLSPEFLVLGQWEMAAVKAESSIKNAKKGEEEIAVEKALDAIGYATTALGNSFGVLQRLISKISKELEGEKDEARIRRR